eukprot:g1592.t1
MATSNEKPLLPIEGAQRQGKRGASAFETGMNMLNELEGSGLLGLPYAASLCGLWAAIACLIVVGSIAGLTGFILAACMYDSLDSASKRRVCASYAEVGRRAFGKSGERAVVFVQMINLLFVGVVYLVLIGNTMHSVVNIISDNSTTDKRLWTCIAFGVCFPTVHLGGYKKVAWMSLIGLVCLGGIIVCGVLFSSKSIYDDGVASMPSFAWKNIFATASMFLFAFSAHGIFPDLEDSMENKGSFGSVVAAVFASNIALKAIVTVTGVLAYGGDTDPVFTANLPHKVGVAVAILVALNTVLSFPLPLIPVFRAIEKYRQSDDTRPATAAFRGFLDRSLVVLMCGIVATAVPNFAIAMGFMGSVTLPFLTFIFPACFFMKLHWPHLSNVQIFSLFAIVCIGCFGCIAGLVSNTLLSIEGTG